jgi:excisionase family DNA binding protein
MTENPQPLLLNVNEVARLLRIHRPKVYDLIRDGTIEGFKVGSDWRIKRSSVEKLVGPIPEDFFQKKSADENETQATTQKLRVVQR